MVTTTKVASLASEGHAEVMASVANELDWRETRHHSTQTESLKEHALKIF